MVVQKANATNIFASLPFLIFQVSNQALGGCSLPFFPSPNAALSSVVIATFL